MNKNRTKHFFMVKFVYFIGTKISFVSKLQNVLECERHPQFKAVLFSLSKSSQVVFTVPSLKVVITVFFVRNEMNC